MSKIRGNNDGPSGRNNTYKIGNRPNVPRRTAVSEVKQGKHPGAHVVKINGREYVRDNPDHSIKPSNHRTHVISKGDNWAYKKEGTSKASKLYRIKGTAISAAVRISSHGSDVIVHKKDGSIQKWMKK